jgi:hypothetical protein
LDIGLKEGNKSSDDNCPSRRENKRYQMAANKLLMQTTKGSCRKMARKMFI